MVDCHQTEEQRPFTLDVVEHAELPRLVVESAGVLSQSLVTVPEESFETVTTLQLGSQSGNGDLDGFLRVDGKSRKSDDRKQSRICLLAVALPWQHRLQDCGALHSLVWQHMDHTCLNK